jgi:hypothetical protein
MLGGSYTEADRMHWGIGADTCTSVCQESWYCVRRRGIDKEAGIVDSTKDVANTYFRKRVYAVRASGSFLRSQCGYCSILKTSSRK